MSNSSVAQKKSQAGIYSRFKKVIGVIVMTVYHLRKIIMTVPVVLCALRLAVYNEQHLPVEVGLFLQNNGDFLRMVSRHTAVFWPLMITFACLFLMLFSRKAMYAWAISIFTLALPLLILISNIYPA